MPTTMSLLLDLPDVRVLASQVLGDVTEYPAHGVVPPLWPGDRQCGAGLGMGEGHNHVQVALPAWLQVRCEPFWSADPGDVAGLVNKRGVHRPVGGLCRL